MVTLLGVLGPFKPSIRLSDAYRYNTGLEKMNWGLFIICKTLSFINTKKETGFWQRVVGRYFAFIKFPITYSRPILIVLKKKKRYKTANFRLKKTMYLYL